MTFLETQMKELGRSTWNDTQHNTADPYLPSMSQMSCSRKTPSRWKSMNIHKHHIQAAVRRCSSKQLLLNILQYSQEYTCVGVSFYVSLLILRNKTFLQNTVGGCFCTLRFYLKLFLKLFVVHLYYLFHYLNKTCISRYICISKYMFKLNN